MKNTPKYLIIIKKIVSFLVKLLNRLFIGLTIALAFISIFKKEWIENFIEWMKEIISGLGDWNYLISFLTSSIESFPVIGIVFPGQNLLLIVGGFFGEISYSNLIFVIITASLGAIIGNWIGYILGAKYGDSFFEKYGNWFGIGLTEVKYLKKGINKWGVWGITFGKFHPLTRAFLPFIAGSMGMKKTSFAIYNIIGSIVRASTIIILGVLFASYYKIFLEYAGYIMLGVMVIIGLYIYNFKREEFKKYLDEKNNEIEAMIEKKNK